MVVEGLSSHIKRLYSGRLRLVNGGYWGKILHIDLSNSKYSIRTFGEDFARKYLGGVGFAARIIYETVTKNTQSLGPSNVLVFATGPYQATHQFSVGKCNVGAKSPLTEMWGESSGGGRIATELKRSGFDALAITGRAIKPAYIWIKNGEVEIRDASNIWGLETPDVVDAIKELVGDTLVAVTCIGQAGENLVRYACIANDKHGYFGRCGLGAVMGSKNLKAIVVRGTLVPPVAHPQKLDEIRRRILKKVEVSPATIENSTHGQAAGLSPLQSYGLTPVKNWSGGTFPGVSNLGAPRYTEELQVKRWACPYCVMGCHRRITNPKYKSKTAGPEYETLAMLGVNLLVDDLEAVVKANDLCNRYGMDTIEVGAILGWAFECYEKGLISKKHTGGIELKWGSGEAVLRMIEKISRREDIGALMADGLRACVDRIPESGPYAVEVMGQAVAAHDPRAYFSMVVTTVASQRGSCHLHGYSEAAEMGVFLPELGITEATDRFDASNKGYLAAIYQDIGQFWNSLTWCFYYWLSDVSLTDQIDILNSITGWDTTPQEAQRMGERIVCLQQIFNLENGLIPKKHNVMPKRLTDPLKDGGAAGYVPPWKEILKEYWETKGWLNGIPMKDKLIELNLEKIESVKNLGFGINGEYRY